MIDDKLFDIDMEAVNSAPKITSSLESVLKADAIRAAFSPSGEKNFYVIEEPWTMIPDPYRCRWFDKRIGEVCEINVFGAPVQEGKYTMFVAYMDDGKVKNFLFISENYHFLED